MAVKREAFKGYGNAAIDLRERARAEGRTELMRVEVLQYAGISGNRFNLVVNSALYCATCSEPVGKAALVGRGSALFYQVDELVGLFLALRDPKAQSVLLADCWALDDDAFMQRYNGRTKREVFDGRHPIVETDDPSFRYAPLTEESSI